VEVLAHRYLVLADVYVLDGHAVCGGFFFFSSRRRHTRYWRDWSSDVCSSDLIGDVVIHRCGTELGRRTLEFGVGRGPVRRRRHQVVVGREAGAYVRLTAVQ